MSIREADNTSKCLFVGFGVVFLVAWIIFKQLPWYQYSNLSHYINSSELLVMIVVSILLNYLISLIEYLRFKYVNCYNKAFINTMWSYFHPIRYYGGCFLIIWILVMCDYQVVPTKYQSLTTNSIASITVLLLVAPLIRSFIKLILSIFISRQRFFRHIKIKVK